MQLELLLILKGFLAGFVIAAPVGPIGFLCIQRALAKGRNYGLASGLGAATADALCGFVAGYGMLFIGNFMVHNRPWLQPVGGLILCALGLKAFFSRPAQRSSAVNGMGLLSAYTSVFFLALTNPVVILTIAAIFVGLGVAEASGDIYHTGLLALGVFLGSVVWWVLLSGSIGVLHKRFDHRELQMVNRISGILLVVFGMLISLSLLFH